MLLSHVPPLLPPPPPAAAPRSLTSSRSLPLAAASSPPQKTTQLPRVPSIPVAATQLANVLSGLHHTFVVADNTLPDCPLVYASEG